MDRLGDRLGKFDDDSIIYRADDPAQKVHWRRVAVSYVVASALAGLLLAGADLVLGQALGVLAVIGLTLVFLTSYILWRRRRNERLTGSATTWPSP
jgi:Flp pilus assembly protein TadB